MTNSPEPAPVRDSKRKRDESDGKCKKKSKKRKKNSTEVAPEGSVTVSAYSQPRATSEYHRDAAQSSTHVPPSSSKSLTASRSDNNEALVAKNANTVAKRQTKNDQSTPLLGPFDQLRRTLIRGSDIAPNGWNTKAAQSSISIINSGSIIVQGKNSHIRFRESEDVASGAPNHTHVREKLEMKREDNHGLVPAAQTAFDDESDAKWVEVNRKLESEIKRQRKEKKDYRSKLRAAEEASQKEARRAMAEIETLRQEMTLERKAWRKERKAIQGHIEDLETKFKSVQSDLKCERKRGELLTKKFLELRKRVNRKPISYKRKVRKQEARIRHSSKQKKPLTEHAQHSRQITTQEPRAHAECAPVCKQSTDESMRGIEVVKQTVVFHQHRHSNGSGKGSIDRVEALEKRLENVETKQLEDFKEMQTCLREKATTTDVTDLIKQLSQCRSCMDAGTNLVRRVAVLEAYRAAEVLVSLKNSDHCIDADFRGRVEKHMQWDDIRFGFLQGLILCLWQKSCKAESDVTKLDKALKERFQEALGTLLPRLGRLQDQFEQYDNRLNSHSRRLQKHTSYIEEVSAKLNTTASEVVLNTEAQNRRLDECELKCKRMQDENAHLQSENGHLENSVDYLRDQILQLEQGASVANNAAHGGDSQNTVSREEFDDCCSKLNALLAEIKTLCFTVKNNENIARQIVPYMRLYAWKFNKKISKEEFAEEMSKLESGELLSNHEETGSTAPLPQPAPVESSTREENRTLEEKSVPKEKPAPRREPIAKRTRSQQAKPQEAPPPKRVIMPKDPEAIEEGNACSQDKDKDKEIAT